MQPEADPQETIEHLREIIGDLAEQMLAAHAIDVIRNLDKKEFLDITDDYYEWPFARSKSHFSFADELFWIYKYSFGPALAEWGYESEVRSACSQKFYSLNHAERAFLVEAFSPGAGLADTAIDRLVGAVLEFVYDNDKEMLREVS